MPVPFERTGFDILVLIDYATRYPDRSESFYQVGFPKQVITDQGVNYMGKGMQQLWRWVRVQALQISADYP